jgi:hypothetical protein
LVLISVETSPSLKLTLRLLDSLSNEDPENSFNFYLDKLGDFYGHHLHQLYPAKNAPKLEKFIVPVKQQTKTDCGAFTACFVDAFLGDFDFNWCDQQLMGWYRQTMILRIFGSSFFKTFQLEAEPLVQRHSTESIEEAGCRSESPCRTLTKNFLPSQRSEDASFLESLREIQPQVQTAEACPSPIRTISPNRIERISDICHPSPTEMDPSLLVSALLDHAGDGANDAEPEVVVQPQVFGML